MIFKEKVPKDAKILRTFTNLKSVLRDNLKVVGEVKNIKAEIDDVSFNKDAIVTADKPEFVIVGASTIVSSKKNSKLSIEA